MAGFNEIGEGGLNNALSKRLSIPGGSPAPSLTPEIFPTLSVGVAWEELAFNQGWRRWQCVRSPAPGGVNPTRLQLRNPTGSGVLVVIEQILFTGATGGGTLVNADIGYGNNPDLATVNSLADPRDTRQTPSGSGVLVISSEDVAGALPATLASAWVPQAGMGELAGGPWLLWNGGTMLLGITSASALIATIIWSERGMTRNELLG